MEKWGQKALEGSGRPWILTVKSGPQGLRTNCGEHAWLWDGDCARENVADCSQNAPGQGQKSKVEFRIITSRDCKPSGTSRRKRRGTYKNPNVQTEGGCGPIWPEVGQAFLAHLEERHGADEEKA